MAEQGPQGNTDKEFSQPTIKTHLNSFNRYELKEEIARGGMGSIHRCRDNQLNRELAIKVLIDGESKDDESRQRFFEEAQINGQLQHPGIVPVYELGKLPDSKPFFAMKLVKGETLKTLLDERESTSVDKNRFLKIFEQVCQTMAYAHSRRVIHRDLKPSNIMVGAFGEVQVMDWGVAKLLTLDDETKKSTRDQSKGGLKIQTLRNSKDGSSVFKTSEGVVFGTLAYMSPEQAMGHHEIVNERSDVFGLGAILCEILSGVPLYDGESTKVLYRRATECCPAEIFNKLDQCEADEELVGIAKSCLSREPDERPAHAGEVADKLRIYFDSVDQRLREVELNQAKVEEKRKKERIKKALVVSVLATIFLMAGFWIFLQAKQAETDKANLRAAAAEADRQRELARVEAIAKVDAIKAKTRQQELSENAERARQKTVETLSDVYTTRGMEAADKDDAGAAIMWFAAAADLAKHDSKRRANNLLRANNWAKFSAIPVGAVNVPGRPFEIELQPNGKLIYVRFTPLQHGYRDDVKIPQLFKDQQQEDLKWLEEVEFPKASCVKNPELFSIFDWSKNEYVSWMPNDYQIGCVCWSPDGSKIAIVRRENSSWRIYDELDYKTPKYVLEIRDANNGEILQSKPNLEEATAMRFNDNGDILAIAGKTLRFWSLIENKFTDHRFDHPAEIHSISFNNDCTKLVTSSIDSVARVFEVNDENSSDFVFAVPHLDIGHLHLCRCRHAPAWNYTEDGNELLISIIGNQEIAVWDVRKKSVLKRIETKAQVIGNTKATKEGVAIGGSGNFEILKNNSFYKPFRHLESSGFYSGIDVSRDGQFILVGSLDTTARLYSLPGLNPIGPILHHDNVVGSVDLEPSKKWLATATVSGLVRIWTHPQPQNRKIIEQFEQPRILEFSKNGRFLVSRKWESYRFANLHNGKVTITDSKTGRQYGPDLEFSGFETDACFSHDSKHLILAHEHENQGFISCFDLENSNSCAQKIQLTSKPFWIASHSRKPIVAAICNDRKLNVVNYESGKTLYVQQHRGTNAWHCFLRPAPNGKYLIVCSERYFECLDFETGQSLYGRVKYPNANKENCTIAISPDSKTIAIGSTNCATFWDLETGIQKGKPIIHTRTSHYLGAISAMKFSPDSNYVLTSCHDKRARLWDWRIGQQVCPPMKHLSKVHFAEFVGRDGRYAVTGAAGKDCGPHLWDLKSGTRLAPAWFDGNDIWSSIATLTISPDQSTVYGCGQIENQFVGFGCDISSLLTSKGLGSQELRNIGELTSAKQITLGQTDTLPKEFWLEKWQRLWSLELRTALLLYENSDRFQ